MILSRFFLGFLLVLAFVSFEQVASQHDYESAFMKQLRDTIVEEPKDGMISKGRPLSLDEVEEQQRRNKPKKWTKYRTSSETEAADTNTSWLGKFEEKAGRRFNWSAVTSAKTLVNRLLEKLRFTRNMSKPTNETFPDNRMIF